MHCYSLYVYIIKIMDTYMHTTDSDLYMYMCSLLFLYMHKDCQQCTCTCTDFISEFCTCTSIFTLLVVQTRNLLVTQKNKRGAPPQRHEDKRNSVESFRRPSSTVPPHISHSCSIYNNKSIGKFIFNVITPIAMKITNILTPNCHGHEGMAD